MIKKKRKRKKSAVELGIKLEVFDMYAKTCLIGTFCVFLEFKNVRIYNKLRIEIINFHYAKSNIFQIKFFPHYHNWF